MFTQDDIIYEYNAYDALRDGNYIDSCKVGLKEITRGNYKTLPVYMTSGVWSLLQKVDKSSSCSDSKGVWHDILWMGSLASRRQRDKSKVCFQVHIVGAGRKKKHVFFMSIGPHSSKDPSPCLVIGLPEEE